jgi:hypothetical protein
MATNLSNIRFLVEREFGETIEDADILNWCNQVNMDVGVNINIPSPTPLSIVMVDNIIEYVLDENLKVINRIRSQSDIDNHIDRELKLNYRIYGGKLILQQVYWNIPDTLIVDYYKNMAVFTDIDNTIDIDDRFTPLYVFYCKIQYHNQRKDSQNVNWRVAINSINTLMSNYSNIKLQVMAYYALRNEPVIISESW